MQRAAAGSDRVAAYGEGAASGLLMWPLPARISAPEDHDARR
jgi:hypothetical protein